MADFSQTEVAPVQSFTTVKEGIAGPRPFLAEGLTNIFKAVGEIGEARTASANEKLVADFVIGQTTIAEAVEQGSITSREALTRMRANFKAAVANSPGLTSDLFAAQASVVGTAGIGQIATTGNEEQARVNRLNNDLVNSGAISATATDEEFGVARTNFQLSEAADARYQEQLKTFELSTKADAQIQRERANASQQWLRDKSPHKLDQFTTQVAAIVDSVGANGTTGEQALLQLDQLWNSINTEYAGALTEAGGYGAGLVVPFQMLYDTAQKQITGEYSTTFANAKVEETLAFQKVLITLDPTSAAAVALSQLGINLPFDHVPLLNNIVSDIIGQNSTANGDPTSVFNNAPDSVEAVKTYYNMLSSVIRKGDMSDDLQTEMITHLSNIFAGTVNGQTALSKNAVLGKDMVRFFSSQEFFTFLSENPSAKDEGYQEALDILQTNYADEVWGMARREFTDGDYISDKAWEKAITAATLGTGVATGEPTAAERTPVTSTIGYRSTDSGMEFFALDPDDASAKAEAKQLNKTLRPVLNETVRGFAHLNGRTDYGTYWNEVSETIFGSKELGDEVLGQGNFSQQPENVSRDTGFVSLVDRVIQQESRGDPNAVSPVGAAGLMQVMPDTARKPGFGVKPLAWGDRFDPVENRRFGEEYLQAMLTEFNGDQARALVAYNWGVGNARKWSGELSDLPAETKNYVQTILGAGVRTAYQSEDEAISAIESGDLKTGDTVVINGVTFRVEE